MQRSLTVWLEGHCVDLGVGNPSAQVGSCIGSASTRDAPELTVHPRSKFQNNMCIARK